MGTTGSALWGSGGSATGTFPLSNAVTSGTIFGLVRAMLVGDKNDTSVFSDEILQPYFNLAYPELYQIMARVQTPRVRREFYYLLPAYTSYLNPLAIGVVDLDEPELVAERTASQIAIASTGTDSPIQVTTQAAHGLGNNADVSIGEVLGSQAPLGRWFVTVVDGLTLTLNGSVSDGNGGLGGNIYTSTGRYFPVLPIRELTDRDPVSRLCDYTWEESVFKFRGATNPSQIRVTYWANGNPPQSTETPLNIEGCSTYLSVRVAGLAAEAKGWYPRADRYAVQALGAKQEADGSGGLLRSFLGTQILGMQRTTFRRQPFRSNDCLDQFSEYPWGILPTG